ncbi:MAG: LysR family transcriptional regulator [Lachnospiraceae bacterium]
MDITYDYYRIFYYVARYGSFSRAAEALLKGQPNITKTISNLEAQLGCTLFVRSNKGVTLTPEGEILFRHAEIAFENLSKAELEIVSERNLDGGMISISATEIGLYGVLIPALGKFKQDYPNVKIRLANFNSPMAMEAVKNGTADFGVVTLHDKADSAYKVYKICDFTEKLYCKKGYMDGKTGDVFSYPYISINANSYTYKFYQNYLLSLGIHKEPDIEVATADQVLPLVKSGMGIGFISDFLAEESLKAGVIEEIPLTTPPKSRSICLVEDKTKRNSVVAQKLKEYLLKN